MSDVRIPLFPLHTVLFPGQVLPLHIFEPRYRAMIALCLQQSSPFGVALIKEGPEVGAQATPAAVGTTARVAQVDTLEDGRMNILAVGESRFRIDVLHADLPYLEATASLWRWPDAESPDLRPLTGSVLALLQGYLTDVGEGENRDALASLPRTPVLVATAAAALPSLPLFEQQRLLEIPTLKDLLLREIVLLRQEQKLAKVLRALGAGRGEPDSPISPN
jgi:Lon protease-like protein